MVKLILLVSFFIYAATFEGTTAPTAVPTIVGDIPVDPKPTKPGEPAPTKPVEPAPTKPVEPKPTELIEEPLVSSFLNHHYTGTYLCILSLTYSFITLNQSQCSFQVSETAGTWDEHNALAMDMDCKLASILSEDEQVMVISKLTGIDSMVWVGGKFIGDGNTTTGFMGPEYWMWSDGSKWSYENWAYDGPSGYGECLKLRPLEKTLVRDWNDEDCSRKRPAVYKCCG